MNANSVIRVQNLSKNYKLYDTSADRLKEAINPFRKSYHRDFCALDDVSFDIGRGETIGIVGRNGSGKSTLLKLITGVLTPSSGSVQTKGNISALLELGAGFNKELSGIENIYFSGALNGFTKAQIDDRLQAILDFADIGEFVYQPVKLYSSGMAARLGFAVAIHVDPDILIVDEALSVGDLGFQNKCFRKIESFVKGGKTVLFVSHALPAIRLFCRKAMWIHQGKVMAFDATDVVTDAYEKFINASTQPNGVAGSSVATKTRVRKGAGLFKDKGDRVPGTQAWIEDVRVLNARNEETAFFTTGELMTVEVGLTNDHGAPVDISLGAAVFTAKGVEVSRINNVRDEIGITLECGFNVVELQIPACPLLTGAYYLSVYLAKENIAELYHKVENQIRFEITTPFAACGWRRYDGLVAIEHFWKTNR